MTNNNEQILYYYTTKDNFPLGIKYAGITNEDTDYSVKRITSNMYIYEYVISGVGHIEINNKKYKVEEGDFFAIPQGQSYRYYSDHLNPWKKIWFYGDGTLMFNIFDTYFEEESIIIVSKNYYKDFQKLIDILINGKNKPISYRKITNQYLKIMTKVYIDYRIMTNNPITQVGASIDQKALFIKNYIDDNLVEEFNLAHLSNQLKLNKVQLIRLFKKEFNTTPYAYYLEGKFEIAENLIIYTDLQIKEIAHRVGFDDEYYFSHTFKKYKGKTPTAIRKLKHK